MAAQAQPESKPPAAEPKAEQTVPGLYVTAREAYERWRAAPDKVTRLDVRTPDEAGERLAGEHTRR